MFNENLTNSKIKITPLETKNVEPIESVPSIDSGTNRNTPDPSKNSQMTNPTYILTTSSDIPHFSSPKYNNLTESKEDTSHDFDSTHQIDHLLDISTPHVTINSTLNLTVESEVTLPDVSNVVNSTQYFID